MELNMEDLVAALSLACSPDVQEVKRGEHALDNVSLKAGYYSALISVISSHGQQISCSEEVRWMAAIALKNGLDKFWRRHTMDEETTLVEQEKSRIRETILMESVMFEKNPKIKILLSVSISKIARLDCPDNWPELLPCLMQHVEQCLHNPNNNNNALLYLYQVTKVLSMKKLPASRQTFRSLAAEAFPIFQQLFQFNYDKFVMFYSNLTNQPGENSSLEERVVDDLLLTIKTIRKLVIHGFQKVREIQEVTNFLEVSVTNHMPVLTKCSLTQPLTQPLPICLCKLYYELIYNDPLCYAPFVGSSMKFLMQTFFMETANIANLSEKFKLKALNLLKLILLCEEYQPNETLMHLEHPLTLQAREAINECLTTEVLVSCIRVCVEFYLLIQPAQLEEWSEDPENFYNQTTTGGESWQANIMAAIQSLFVTLIKQNTDVSTEAVSEIYLSVIGQNQGIPQDTRAIIAFDAVLHAMGLALYDLNVKANLDSGLLEVLEKFIYANNSNEDMKILRRRVFWFLAYWVDIGLPEEMLGRLLKMIVFAFNSEKDAVVFLTLVRTIHVLVDNLDIPQELIVQHTPVIVSCLHSMIQSLEQDDSKSRVLSTFSLVIDKTRFDLLPFLDRILSLLENLWTESNQDSQQFLRSAVVECLGFVVVGLKEKCDACYILVKPLLCHCLDHDNEQSLNLMTDGLDLLLNFVQNTITEDNTDLLTFVSNVLPCLELGAEYVHVSLHVISSYAVLFRRKLALSYGLQINAAFLSLFKDTSRDIMTLLVQTIKNYFRLCITSEKDASMDNSLIELLRPLLQEVLDQDCSSLVEADLIGLFSRLILEQSQIFVTILTVYGSESNVTPESVLCRLIGIICDCIDDIVCVRTRKLTALALIYALNPNNTSVELIKKRFVDVVYVCLSCLHDLADVITGAEDMLLVRSPQVVVEGLGSLSESVETAHDRREQLLDQSCLTSSVSLKEQLGNLFSVLRNNHAVPFDELFNSIDSNCRFQLEQFYFPK